MRAKMRYICKKFINHQIKKCLLFRCRHAVDSRYNANFKLDQSFNWGGGVNPPPPNTPLATALGMYNTMFSIKDKRQDIRFTKQISVTRISNLPSKFHVLLIF